MTIGTLIFVTGEANFGLCLLVAHLISWRMDCVATVAGNLIVLVLAAIPIGASGTLVACQTLA